MAKCAATLRDAFRWRFILHKNKGPPQSRVRRHRTNMPRYPKSAVTAKRSINHVRTVVEDAGSLFIKIEQDNDLGIDALIELIQDGKPLNRQIAVQIKSGQSYYNTDAGDCLFPIRMMPNHSIERKSSRLGPCQTLGRTAP